MNVDVRNALKSDSSEIHRIYENCKKRLLNDGLLQWGDWDEGYPGIDFIRDTTLRNEMFILSECGKAAGAVAVNETQSPEWSEVEWSALSLKPAVIHALVIAPRFQGRGLAKNLLDWCEEYAAESGYDSLRLDSFEKNSVSNRLYTELGFEPRGRVIFNTKPDNNQIYICYEKILNRGKI